jgi:hypothetical protein
MPASGFSPHLFLVDKNTHPHLSSLGGDKETKKRLAVAIIPLPSGDESPLPRRPPCRPPESGKAHLASAAVNTLVVRGRPVLFATTPELLAMIRDRFNAGQTEELTEVCQRVPWLVVDDLGAERLTDWAAEVLFCVFNARYTAGAHTLVVSNVRPEEVPEPRLRSRFLGVAVCQVVPNGGGGLTAVWREGGCARKIGLLAPARSTRLDLSSVSLLCACVRSLRSIPMTCSQPYLVERQPKCSPRNYRLGNESVWCPISVWREVQAEGLIIVTMWCIWTYFR